MRPNYNAPREELWDYIGELEFITGITKNQIVEDWVRALTLGFKQHIGVTSARLNANSNSPGTSQVARLLVALCMKDDLVSNQTIVQFIKTHKMYSFDPALARVIIHKARKTFKALGRPNPILTIHGVGATLTPEARAWIETFKPQRVN